MRGIICFDMDGTIADLYGYPNWLELLRKEDPTPYYKAKPLVDMDTLNIICGRLWEQGWEIRIISWLSKDSTAEYKEAVRQAKMYWLWEHHFPYGVAHMVAYGTTKADCVRRAGDCPKILVDDNAKIRDGWHLGKTIDATKENWLDELAALID